MGCTRGVPAFRCQTILDHFFHQFAGETSFPQLILSQKIEDCRGMWNVDANNKKKPHTYDIHVFRYLDQLTIHIYDWARFFKQAKTGFSWFPLLQLMSSPLNVEQPPRENQPESTVLLVGNAISHQKIFFFKKSISPGCLVHLPECILSIEERLSHVFCGRVDL